MRTFAEKPKATQQATPPKTTVPARSHLGHTHEMNSILHLQRTIGNQAVQRLLQSNAEERNAILIGTTSPQFGNDFSRIPIHHPAAGAIQAKLAINTPGDEYEHEADRVADQVMRMPEPKLQRACACGGGCPKCQTEAQAKGRQGLQTKRVGAGALGLTEAPPSVLDVLRSPGQPLDSTAKAYFEPRFRHDFSRVRVHSNNIAQQSAKDLDARAYTVGDHIVFSSGHYAPGSGLGRRLFAHELTHVIQQQDSTFQEGCLLLQQEGGSAVREAESVARSMLLSVESPAIRSRTQHQVQRQAVGAGAIAEVAEFEEDRRHFEAEQASFFADVGEIIRRPILQAAGFAEGQTLSTAADALRVVHMWGVTLQTLTGGLPQVTQSLSGQVQGQQTSQRMEQQQQSLVAMLTPVGRQAFQAMLLSVRSEPFWRQHLAQNEIYVFPDLTGSNRYAGYTQRGRYQTMEGLTQTAFIIHISKDRLNAGEVEASSATLIHELSHTLHEPNVTARSLRSLTQRLADLLADHPKIVAMRWSAPDAQQARQIHVRRIEQILFEHTGYAEAEIFVHLQQLTHQPPVQAQGETVQAHHYILGVVEGYVAQLRRIGLPPRMLAGILRSLSRRVAQLYARRIAAVPAGSSQRRLLELSRDQALTTMNLAIHD